MSDRRVHASNSEFEVVRYGRAGKWYIEPRHPDQGKRQHVNIDQAVHFALHLAKHVHGKINLNVDGGSLFDKRVQRRM